MSYKEQLILKIESYLNKQLSISNLADYAWSTCDELLTDHSSLTILEHDASFWYSLWEVQQMGSKLELSVEDEQVLSKSLNYMRGVEPLPEGYLTYGPLRRQLRQSTEK